MGKRGFSHVSRVFHPQATGAAAINTQQEFSSATASSLIFTGSTITHQSTSLHWVHYFNSVNIHLINIHIRNERNHIVYNCCWNKKYIIICYLNVIINSIASIILNEIEDRSVSWRRLYIATGIYDSR